MLDLFPAENQILQVTDFNDLVSKAFYGEINAIYWNRKLIGDFAEIVNKIEGSENIRVVDEYDLHELILSEQGQIAREILFNDLKLLSDYGAAPVLNIIKSYDRDDDYPFFPTDVYSYHIDRSPIPTDTFLCTYFGNTSEILPNAQAQQKIWVPEIRNELKKLYDGNEEDFESFLIENFFDLHYQALPNASPIPLSLGHIWRLAIDHPDLKVPPCIHRAPIENSSRMLLIC